MQNNVLNVDQLNILNKLVFMHKVNTIFFPKFQKPAHPYPTNFSKQLSRSKHRISVRGPCIFNRQWKRNHKFIAF